LRFSLSASVLRDSDSFPPRRSSDLVTVQHPLERPTWATEHDSLVAVAEDRDTLLDIDPSTGATQASLRFGGRAGQHSALIPQTTDRKSTRLNSSHVSISYAVFCLNK